MKNRSEDTETDPIRPTASGFSLIEVLVAAVLLLVIALGLIPLFTRAMLDNANGRDATTATNFDRSQLETQNPLPLDFAPLLVPVGQTVKETRAYYWTGDRTLDNDAKEGWHSNLPDPTKSDEGIARWTRITRVRQYRKEDLDDDGLLNQPLDGSSDQYYVHFKEVEVAVQGMNSTNNVLGNVLGGGPQVTFRTLKSY